MTKSWSRDDDEVGVTLSQVHFPASWRARLLVFVVAVFDTAAVAAARADEISDFYRGKEITLYVGFSPGGGYDVYARLLPAGPGKSPIAAKQATL